MYQPDAFLFCSSKKNQQLSTLYNYFNKGNTHVHVCVEGKCKVQYSYIYVPIYPAAGASAVDINPDIYIHV